MKKFYLCAVLAVFALLANAQVIVPVQKGQGAFSKSSEKIVVNKNVAKRVLSKAASLDGTQTWGYYMESDLDNAGAVGVGAAATYWAGYFVPGDGILKGSSINGINFPVNTATNMTDVSIWISEDLETNLVSQSVDASTLSNVQFNAIALDEPFAIPESGIFVGVKFTITRISSESDKYPVVIDSEGKDNKNSLVMKYGDSTGESDWGDYSSNFGSFAMQLFCSNMAISERYAYIKSASSATSLAGAEVSLPVVIGSDSSEGVSSIDYVVDINGNKQSRHLDLTTPIAGGISKSGGTEYLSFTAPETVGTYDAVISIEKVNGQANDAIDEKVTVTNKVLTKIVTRRSVVEEYTGTTCPWCPRGWVGMELLKESRENFIGIAIHKYSSSDPMYLSNYPSSVFSSAPSCMIDRSSRTMDPFWGSTDQTTETDRAILDDFDYYNSILPDVDVKVSGMFNADNTAVDIKAEVEYLTEGDDYNLVYVLTADKLSGTSSSWRQANNYASYSSSQFTDPLIAQFARGGDKGSSYVSLEYNDVVIGSSYNSNGSSNLAPALGETVAGSVVSSEYTINMPTKTTLKNAINNDEVYAVVFVLSSDGKIANAARAKVTSYDTNGISDIINSEDVKEVARYSIDGRRLSAPEKGINIVKYSNGKTVKVVE